MKSENYVSADGGKAISPVNSERQNNNKTTSNHQTQDLILNEASDDQDVVNPLEIVD